MDEGIARANIAHFKKLLLAEPDDAKRRILRQLLTEEETKLTEARRRKAKK